MKVRPRTKLESATRLIASARARRSKHARRVRRGGDWVTVHATKRRPWTVRAENRRRNRAARQARKRSR